MEDINKVADKEHQMKVAAQTGEQHPDVIPLQSVGKLPCIQEPYIISSDIREASAQEKGHGKEQSQSVIPIIHISENLKQ